MRISLTPAPASVTSNTYPPEALHTEVTKTTDLEDLWKSGIHEVSHDFGSTLSHVNVPNTSEIADGAHDTSVHKHTNIGIMAKLSRQVQTFLEQPQTFIRSSLSMIHLCSESSWGENGSSGLKHWLTDKACQRLFPSRVPVPLSAERTGDFLPDHVLMEDDQLWQNPPLDDVQPQESGGKFQIVRTIPDFVMEYAPLVHLYSGEEFWPCDMTDHLLHISSTINYTILENKYQNLTLANLDTLNQWQQGLWIFLTSNDNVEERPDWLEGAKNIPATNLTGAIDNNDDTWTHHPGRTHLQSSADLEQLSRTKDGSGEFDTARNARLDEKPSAQAPRPRTANGVHDLSHDEMKQEMLRRRSPPDGLRGGRSEAPAVLLVVDKGNGVMDAFWFFFYSFNLGNSVFNVRFGNHVGDWEHSAVRFHHGKPKAVYFSEHNFGSAYSYDAVEKLGKRPIIYSATGTHAMYATSGSHPYVLPWGILHDQTDKGPLWDPILNSHTYTYDFKNDVLRASNLTPHSPTEWFYFSGHWGDKAYPLDDRRQYRFAGQYHYVHGPIGPRFKNLGRKKICGGPEGTPCVIKNWLGGSSRMERWQRQGQDADAFSAMEEERRSNLAR